MRPANAQERKGKGLSMGWRVSDREEICAGVLVQHAGMRATHEGIMRAGLCVCGDTRCAVCLGLGR